MDPLTREVAHFLERTGRSRAIWEEAKGLLPHGVSSNYQVYYPYPLYLTTGRGARIQDVDGHEYVDFCMGHGALFVGHAHPVLVEEMRAFLTRSGTLFCIPTEELLLLARELKRRFPLDLIRFCNSGTEATMHALRVARGFTGREKIVKIEGGYHGAHDSLLASVGPFVRPESGSPDCPQTLPASAGLPGGALGTTLVVPFNDPTALERCFRQHPGEIAAVIMEPVMQNVAIVLPEAGYLEAVRDLTRRHGALLIFDEVKTGAKLAPGGASQHYGVTPDLICLSKAIGGGYPLAAFGGRRDVMEVVEPGAVAHYGTYNGNPLAVHAGLVTLTRILTDEIYPRTAKLSQQLADGVQALTQQVGLPLTVTSIGPNGAFYRAAALARDMRGVSAGLSPELNRLFFTAMLNRGIFPQVGLHDQWTVSVQHTEADLQAYLAAFGEVAGLLVEATEGLP